MRPDTTRSDGELKKRLATFYDKDPISYEDGQFPFYREKLTNLSEYVREFSEMIDKERLRRYRRFPYETGAMEKKTGSRRSDVGTKSALTPKRFSSLSRASLDEL